MPDQQKSNDHVRLRDGFSCQAQLLAMAAGEPRLIDPETARMVRGQITGALPGWFQFRPLWDQITAEQPDLFD